MVQIKKETFNETQYDSHFKDAASFELSDFQKWAIKGIREGDNVLITAHTGSGKTLPAEYMIKYFTTLAEKDGRHRKRVIYASPIKALSNQKLYDMRTKFPDVSFGLLTGDCKDNPEADVLIMTTEILRNTLFNKRMGSINEQTDIPLSFDMDIDNDLGGVIFDEVHYINDADRGSVWEQSILLLSPKVQLLMLSATIDSPEHFASWIEDEKAKQSIQLDLTPRGMILAPTDHRVVPLTHYMWLSAPSGAMKKLSKTDQACITPNADKMIVIKSPKTGYDADAYKKVRKAKSIMWDNYIKVHRQYVLNSLVRHLKKEEMLPAICFIFSRKQVEVAAKSIEVSLFDEGETHSSTVEKECRKIIAARFPNHKEYTELPEYRSMVALLQKGIAIHHAGVLPVLREMVELLFDKGYIRLLFATETFAVGINMPTKTVVFTALDKFDGNGKRPLYPHEYTQMAGRAGRRGLDTVGHVIHCNNLFDAGHDTEYKQILCGKPQRLTSKFRFEYGLVLSVMASGASDLEKVEEFVSHSLIGKEIKADITACDTDIESKQTRFDKLEASISNMRTPKGDVEKYIELMKTIKNSKPKQQKKLRREADNLIQCNKGMQTDIDLYNSVIDAQAELDKANSYKTGAQEYLGREVKKVTELLKANSFVDETDSLSLTPLGWFASQLQECHPLACANIIQDTQGLAAFSPGEIAAFASIFANIKRTDEALVTPKSGRLHLDQAAQKYSDLVLSYENQEAQARVWTGNYEQPTFDLMEVTIEWCEGCTTEEECKSLVHRLETEKGIGLGDFVKAMLKITNVCAELEKIAEISNNLELAEKLATIPSLVMKYVVTNGSLYV